MTPPRPTPATVAAGALLALAAYAVAAADFVRRGLPNADEGFYAYCSYAAMHGAVPYRDFAYTQTPLLPYLEGPVLAVVGYGVRQQRWLDVGWSAAALAVMIVLFIRAGLPRLWQVILGLAWCLCPGLVYYSSVGKTYGLAELLTLAAALCLAASAREGGAPRRLALLAGLSLAGVLAVGCRLTAAPVAALLWLGFAVVDRGRTSRVLLLGLPALLGLLLIGPFFALDPRNAVFWTWTYHHLNQARLSRPALVGESVAAAPAVAALALAGLALVAGGRPVSWRWREPGPWILVAGIAGWLLPVALSGLYAEYAVPSLPLVLAGFGLVLAAAPPRWRGPAPAAVAGAAVAIGAFSGPSHLLPGYLAAVDRTATVVRQSSRPGEIVLTSMPEVALAAGRPIFPRLEMGKFGLTGEMDPDTARLRHVLPFQELLDAVSAAEAPTIVLFNRDPGWNFGWSIPSFRVIPPASTARLQRMLEEHYRVIEANEFFLVYRTRTGPRS